MTSAIERLLLAFGVRPERVAFHRDGLLGVPVVIGLILAAGPLFLLVEHERVPMGVLHRGIIGLAVAVLVSLISPNWNLLLAGGCLFLALRAALALVINWDLRVLALGTTFLALGLLCLRLRSSKPR